MELSQKTRTMVLTQQMCIEGIKEFYTCIKYNLLIC